MKRGLLQTPAFLRAIKRFVKKKPSTVSAIRDALILLEKDAFDARLRTHKLKGDLSGCWASSAGPDLRIVFEFVAKDGNESILLLSAGTHDEVY